MATRRRIGVIGFGKIGQFLVEKILSSNDLELAFVWNRDPKAVRAKVDSRYILEDLKDFASRNPHLVVEVAHPDITREFGEKILEVADYMIGSPTALADDDLMTKIRAAAVQHGLYVPSGALWGAEDIHKMADNGSLQALKITMIFHPSSLKLLGSLKEMNESVISERTVLYDGCVRKLCSLAPNNVNTMAAAAVAGHSLGFDLVQGCLVSDPGLSDMHLVQVDVWGEGDIPAGKAFHVQTIRSNPSSVGSVTGSATVMSFFASLRRAFGKGQGVHIC